MDGDIGDEAIESRPARRRALLRWAMVVTGLLVLLLLALWTQRQPIAENFISRELMARGVRADYQIVKIGLRTQRIENLVLGDPGRPDLTAEWAEIDLSFSGLSPHVVAVRAGGVRMMGALHKGILTLGEVDRLRATDSTAPFSLPDIALGLRDARMRLDTDYGQLGLKLEGDGNLRSGFRGKLAAMAPQLAMAGCGLTNASAWLNIAIREGRPQLQGPVRGAALGCKDLGIGIAQPVFTPDVTLSATLDHWTGHVDINAFSAKAAGLTLVKPNGRIALDSDARRTQGQIRLAAAAFDQGTVRLARTELTGAYSVAGADAQLNGALSGARLALTGPDRLAGVRAATAGTPVAPLAVRLTDAVTAAGRDNRIQASFSVLQKAGVGSATLTAADFTSRSGVRAGLGQDSRVTLGWPKPGGGLNWALNGSVTLGGGGLPTAALRLAQRASGGFGGQLFMDPYTAPGASLALETVRFSAAPAGATHFATQMRLTGPLSGGAIRDLVLPIDGQVAANGTLTVNARCTPISLASLKYGSLTLGATRASLCPESGALLAYGPSGVSGGARINALRLDGKLGGSDMRLSADRFRGSLAARSFALDNALLLLGTAQSPVRLGAAAFAGKIDAHGLSGTMANASGRIGAVPLLVGDAAGRWNYAANTLSVNGNLTLTDAQTPGRFEPLISRDFTLALRDNRITAKGSLLEPKTGALVARTDIIHALGTGQGRADLDVPGITFAQNLQPEMLTRLALGVVANARGTVTGKGQVRWTGSNVTSDGDFRTDNLDFAAAFGPVTGLSGNLHFTDLVGLVSAPGQLARVKSVNPGIEVTQGEIRYQLLPNQQMRIEGGEWPFAGGQLSLLPTTMDFSADKPRNLAFRVVGLDAGAFIQTLELENISATGTYDGLLPMVFDESGGRIVGGVLAARQIGRAPLVLSSTKDLSITCDPALQGGTLAYVGPVSNEQLGVFGKMAFDALKNLQYKCLTILMDGALDGELVTQVSFNGVNRGKLGDAPAGIARSFIGLPFLFNIRIEAPFRGLLNSAQSFVDPSGLIRNNLGDQYAPVTTVAPKTSIGVAVQPAESDKSVTKDNK
ncbi:exoprotein [Sphingobium sp. SCG-1]|uniref:intermembrane phospholipid transport protein YdbH family protein n=1 Tax=Sphingobium sp. SCG-1 TaxID=2072936 RepID=UPI000CD67841|nr:YdbH domain-containing protein [Sphingobium sp. SCG-1]AUW57890.1 exoprotein [Sphingobium sp. SCG-1]